MITSCFRSWEPEVMDLMPGHQMLQNTSQEAHFSPSLLPPSVPPPPSLLSSSFLSPTDNHLSPCTIPPTRLFDKYLLNWLNLIIWWPWLVGVPGMIQSLYSPSPDPTPPHRPEGEVGQRMCMQTCLWWGPNLGGMCSLHLLPPQPCPRLPAPLLRTPPPPKLGWLALPVHNTHMGWI